MLVLKDSKTPTPPTLPFPYSSSFPRSVPSLRFLLFIYSLTYLTLTLTLTPFVPFLRSPSPVCLSIYLPSPSFTSDQLSASLSSNQILPFDLAQKLILKLFVPGLSEQDVARTYAYILTSSPGII